jgi:hypothetical protein
METNQIASLLCDSSKEEECEEAEFGVESEME